MSFFEQQLVLPSLVCISGVFCLCKKAKETLQEVVTGLNLATGGVL